MSYSLRIWSLLPTSLGILTLVSLLFGLATDYWLFTMEEPMEIQRDEEYHDLTEFEPIQLHSGLLRVCVMSGGSANCSHVSYFGPWQKIEEAETTTDILCEISFIINCDNL